MTRLKDAQWGENQMVETFWRWRAKCNSTGIMFTAFTGTRIRPEEDALSRLSAVSEILFRGLRFTLPPLEFLD